MSVTGLILVVAMAAVPPLTAEQRQRLDGARDGIDARGAAFDALHDNVRQWTAGVGDAPIRLQPDLDAVLADPAAFRGELFQITGSIQQQTRPPEQPQLGEWFVRDESDRPILLYVYGLSDGGGFEDGKTITLPARFYKRVEAVARDGRVREYPAFVGAFPRLVADAAGPRTTRWAGLWLVATPIMVMMGVFALLMIYTRRGGRRPRTWTRPARSVESDPLLPDDPVEALAELRRRARPEEA